MLREVSKIMWLLIEYNHTHIKTPAPTNITDFSCRFIEVKYFILIFYTGITGSKCHKFESVRSPSTKKLMCVLFVQEGYTT